MSTRSLGSVTQFLWPLVTFSVVCIQNKECGWTTTHNNQTTPESKENIQDMRGMEAMPCEKQLKELE